MTDVLPDASSLSLSQELEAKGIRCKMFFPIKPTLSTHHNNRDHRKIAVIDGHTRGYRRGKPGRRIHQPAGPLRPLEGCGRHAEGEAVKSFTMMFLQMWNVTESRPDDYSRYIPKEPYIFPGGWSPRALWRPMGTALWTGNWWANRCISIS